MTSLQFFTLFKKYNETVKKRTNDFLKMNKSHYTAILPKSLKHVKLVSSLLIKTNIELKLFSISCTNFRPNFILMLF